MRNLAIVARPLDGGDRGEDHREKGQNKPGLATQSRLGYAGMLTEDVIDVKVWQSRLLCFQFPFGTFRFLFLDLRRSVSA